MAEHAVSQPQTSRSGPRVARRGNLGDVDGHRDRGGAVRLSVVLVLLSRREGSPDWLLEPHPSLE